MLQPSDEILKKFDKLSFGLQLRIIKNEKFISILEKTRGMLLPKLMSGEIRV